MTRKLESAFRSYTAIVQTGLRKRGKVPIPKRSLRLFMNKTLELQSLVDELERKTEFYRLVEETYSSYPENFYLGERDRFDENYRIERCIGAIQNFFRRSGYYLDTFERRDTKTDEMFKLYMNAFQKEEFQFTYLAIIENVRFAEEYMDFGEFQVRQFSLNELSEIIGNKINEIFYPKSILDVKQLKDYWFIHFRNKEKHYGDDSIWEYFRHVVPLYTRYPKTIELILQQLSLYDLRLEEYKADFRIPFVVEVNDDLLVGRYAPPGFCDLERETYLDPDTGEETDRGPADSIVLNDDETRNFKAFVSHLGNLLRSLRARKSDWPFLDIALNYYIKAYFDFGVEQLLWYIVVLEALLGEKAEGLTERLARRLGLILGRTEKERREIRRQFRELYEFRCNLVHGNLFRKEIYHEHLDIARNLARKALIWFLNYLGIFSPNFPNINFQKTSQPEKSSSSSWILSNVIEFFWVRSCKVYQMSFRTSENGEIDIGSYYPCKIEVEKSSCKISK